MASSTGPNTSNTANRLKRTLSWVTQHGDNNLPATKRLKWETRLDRLRAEQKSEAGNLKTNIELVLELIKSKDVANESSLKCYVDSCNGILAGMELDEVALETFEMPFTDHFKPEGVLLKNLGPPALDALNNRLFAINELLPNFVQLSKDALVELQALPEPSAYAHHKTWRVWQNKDTAILNLRPPTNEGLPIEILHPAFASFVYDVKSIPPDEWVVGDNINRVSMALCQAMACDFESEGENEHESERTRRTELTKQLRSLGLGLLQVEFHIERTLPLETHGVRPDLYLSVRGNTVLLGEIRSEFEAGDPYMHASRSYQALVHHMQDQKRASDGVPCILLVVCGPLLTVAAGFFDGNNITVEPLTDPCTMLPSRHHRREKRLAQVLSFTRKAIQTLSQPSTSKLSPPRTPRIYSRYVNPLGQCVDLEFIEFLGPSSHDLCPSLQFLARDPTSPSSTLLVKLVDPNHYSEEVHRTLADEGLAPLLHGTAPVAGAPSAIIMEYLDPPSGWTTLQNYIGTHREIMISIEHPALVRLLKTMKEKKVVHGDLRPNNIMCRARADTGTKGKELEIKVVDFDWAGKLGSAKYPAIMDPAIEWPGVRRGVIGENDDETLLTRTLAMV